MPELMMASLRTDMLIITLLALLYPKYGITDDFFAPPPPTLILDRTWELAETEPPGTVVTRVRASGGNAPTGGEDNTVLSYGLEKNDGWNPSGLPPDPRPLPFRIDPLTGVVFTNESLQGRGGENIYLYVTVSNGHLTQKTEVWASILGSDGGGSVRGGQPQAGGPGRQQTGGGRPPPPPPLPPPHRPPPRPSSRPPPPPSGLPPATTKTSASNRTLLRDASEAPVENAPAENEIFQTPSGPMPPHDLPPAAQDLPPDRPALSTGPSGELTQLLVTVLPVSLVSVALGVLGLAAFLFRRRICNNRKKAKSKEEMKKKNSTSGSGSREEPMVLHNWTGPRAFSNRYTPWDANLSPPPIPDQEPPDPPVKYGDRWEFPRHHLKVFSILGEGCFGQVWKCEALNIAGSEGPTIVAVKTLKENAGERERSDLLTELQVMKSLEPHPNVVKLLGCCTEKEPYFVIMEYVALGKLQAFLRSSRASRSYDNLHGKSGTLTSRQLTSFCYQVARGMEYLSSKGIIHRDLAARNILVSTDLTCKVADFGFARDVIANHIYERKSEGRLPIRWMAPESLYDNVFSVKSDIWSFGVAMWEIVTLGSTPYPGLSAQEVMRQVKEGTRLEKPEHCKREVYNIMFYCWDPDPESRPDFGQLVNLLEELLMSETDYIELQRFPDHSYYNMVSLSGEKV